MFSLKSWPYRPRVLARLWAILFAMPILAAPSSRVVPLSELDPILFAALVPTGASPHRAEDIRQDPLPFVARLSARIAHGERHDELDRGWLLRQMRRGDLSLTCGPAVTFVQTELKLLGVDARAVILASSVPQNGFDDGHILLEVETRRGEVLVDVDQKRLFLVDGRPASLQTVRQRGFVAVELAPFGPSSRIDNSSPLARYSAAILANPRPW